jgi:hypothetical protein
MNLRDRRFVDLEGRLGLRQGLRGKRDKQDG